MFVLHKSILLHVYVYVCMNRYVCIYIYIEIYIYIYIYVCPPAEPVDPDGGLDAVAHLIVWLHIKTYDKMCSIYIYIYILITGYRCIYIYIYIYIYILIHIHVYIYIYWERERDSQTLHKAHSGTSSPSRLLLNISHISPGRVVM